MKNSRFSLVHHPGIKAEKEGHTATFRKGLFLGDHIQGDLKSHGQHQDCVPYKQETDQERLREAGGGAWGQEAGGGLCPGVGGTLGSGAAGPELGGPQWALPPLRMLAALTVPTGFAKCPHVVFAKTRTFSE